MSEDVCIVDPICFKPYDGRSLEDDALAGTEATVVHVATALGWTVLQRTREV